MGQEPGPHGEAPAVERFREVQGDEAEEAGQYSPMRPLLRRVPRRCPEPADTPPPEMNTPLCSSESEQPCANAHL